MVKSKNAFWVCVSDYPVLRIMDSVAEIMGNWYWGPTGSAGFELATGHPSVKETSDLDIVVHAPRPIEREEAADLLRKLDKQNVRVDTQVEKVGEEHSFSGNG